MLYYPRLNSYWRSISSEKDLRKMMDYLIEIWLDDYFLKLPNSVSTNIVKVTLNTGFSYLFDISQERLIAAWGISKGKSNEPRDKPRMKGYPMSEGKRYHRGHAIAHQLGGGTDINLLAQRGSINIGQFRVLENEAVKTPGAFYFTYWQYNKFDNQKPDWVQQGLLCPGKDLDARNFMN